MTGQAVEFSAASGQQFPIGCDLCFLTASIGFERFAVGCQSGRLCAELVDGILKILSLPLELSSWGCQGGCCG